MCKDTCESAGDLNRAFSMLETYGVPRSRASTVCTGIDVLMTRMNRALREKANVRKIRQWTVGDWVARCFTDKTLKNTHERTQRLVEEVIELAQAENVPISDVYRLVDYVYGRPKGDPAQEVGGISITLLAYCASKGFSADELEEKELTRILALPAEHFMQRQKAKAEAGIAIHNTPETT